MSEAAIYLEHGEAYGNLGDEAMLVNAARRITERLGPVPLAVAHDPAQPFRSLAGARPAPAPRAALAAAMRGLLPHLGLRRRALRAGAGRLWGATASLLARTGGRVPGGRAWQELTATLRTCRAVYCVGAANLNDLASEALAAKTALIAQAARLGLPVVVSSQGVGPLEDGWKQRAVLRAIAASTHFSLRDGGTSAALLGALGVDPARLPTVGDEAFSLPPASAEAARDFLQAHGVDPAQGYIVFHWRANDYTKDTAQHYAALAAALDAAECAAPFVFLPMSTGRHSGEDAECGQAIRAKMREPKRLTVLPYLGEAGLARRLVGLARGVAALSYHLQVFALAEARPMIILSSGGYYGAKARGMRALAGPETPLIDLDSAEWDSLRRALNDLAPPAPERAAALEAARRRVADINDAPVEALQRAVSGG